MEKENKEQFGTLPMIALRGLVMFPGMLLHFEAGREKSVAALKAAMELNKEILLVSQKDILIEDPNEDEMYKIGCTAKVKQMLKVGDGIMRVLVEGQSRVKLMGAVRNEPYWVCNYKELPDVSVRASALYKEAALRHIKSIFDEYAAVAPKLPNNVILNVRASDDVAYIADYIASNIQLEHEDKQAVLEERNPLNRIERLTEILEKEIELLNIDIRIAKKVKTQMDDNQKEYYLREQLKAVREELYGNEDGEDEGEEYRSKVKSLCAPNDIKEQLFKEIDKLAKMPMGSQEATVVRNYLDICISLPWGVYTNDKIVIKKATSILEKEHYGLDKVKERIIEALAVYSLTGNVGGSIICLVGPPGVGKTSIAKSIAHCMDRRFARISLGGVHDEAEIRGHRKTYIGAMQGKIIDAVKQAGSSNPVILLDEIDKLGADYKGDPSAALLEALDPEQNSTFKDNFINMPYDLSKVLFITTANNAETIPGPLFDRMEVIELSGYTREDKFNIAKKYLVKKQLEKNGVNKDNCKIANSAIYKIIDAYTREAGVRRLEQSIASICRKAAKEIVAKETEVVSVNDKNIDKYLGVEKFREDMLLPYDEVGVVNGLAWTQVGGTLMQLEASILDGNGKLELTGSLGEVMQESAKAALSYVRSIADVLGLDKEFYNKKDFHIHATQAAIPKDGPSAGVTITTALVSALTGIPIKRDIAMTGEVTLRGRVLAIGGLKEKTMAAYTAGVKTVFIPSQNIPNLEEIEPKIRAAIKFIPVDNVWDVVTNALVKPIKDKKSDIENNSLLQTPEYAEHRCKAVTEC